MSSFEIDNDTRYRLQIAKWIESTLAVAVPSFGDLVTALPGVDPRMVLVVLREMSRGGALSTAATQLLDEAHGSAAPLPITVERPLPHPLDFYWAFTEDTIGFLVSELASAVAESTVIAHVGTPNVFAAALKSMPRHLHVLIDLVDRHQEHVRPGNAHTLRLDLLRDELPRLGASVALTDPPWYPAHMRGFLWAAATMVTAGSEVWMSAPPAGTRPGVEEQVVDLLSWAEERGMTVVGRVEMALRYRSPPYELAAQRASGIGAAPASWRASDLIRFRIAGAPLGERPRTPIDDDQWLRFIIDEVPISIRQRPSPCTHVPEPLLVNIVVGDVLDSVSRRDPRRASVDVWTSMNRVWRSPCPAMVSAICGAVEIGSDTLPRVESLLGRKLNDSETNTVAATTTRIKGIVRHERREHGLQDR